MNSIIFHLVDALYSYGNGADCDKQLALDALSALLNKLINTDDRPSNIKWNGEKEVFEVDC